MSWSLTFTKDLSAELRLAQAISEFKTSLTVREKLDFEAQKIKHSNEPPTAQDVYRLTAEIDRSCEKASRGRVFGPRFMNILQAVQRFASLGDVLVGGSQNLLACGVWTGVRFALMTLASRATTIDQISELFMHVGRQAPKYEELAHLYPDSKKLQNSLFDYFIEIIHLCEYLVKYTKKTTIQHVAHIFGDTEINKFRSQLDIHGRAIKDEITMLTMSLIKAEASRSEKFRARYLGESQLAVLKRQAKLKGQVLDRCSTYDYEATWKDLRKAGTAQLHLQEEGYAKWKSRSSSSTLIWQGKIGCGKSVLLANIIEDLNLNLVDPNTLIAYFFCRWDVAESLQARTILGSLAKQILKAFFDGTSNDLVWQAIASTSDSASFEELTILIIKSVPNDSNIIFVMDGFDECSKLEAHRICIALQSLQKAINMKICVSTGLAPLHDLVHKSPLDSLEDVCTVIVPEENPDIAMFIDLELAKRLQSGELMLGDGCLILKIRDALLQGAQGMMLWVALQIDAICVEKSDERIRQALQDLPTTLSKIFTRELDRSFQTSSSAYRDRIFNVLLATVRPLDIEELSEALSVEPGNTNWQPAKHVNDVRSVLLCCGRLVSIDEESSAVRISHHSIKKYLIAEYIQVDGLALSEFSTQRFLANIIVTYLSYGVFDRQVSTRVIPHLPTQAVVPTILSTTLKPHAGTKLALKLLQLKKLSDFDLGKTIAKLNNEEEALSSPEFPFRRYAEEYYLQHARTYLVEGSPPYTDLLPLVIARVAPDTWEFVLTMKSLPRDVSVLSRMQYARLMSQIGIFSWASNQGFAALITCLKELWQPLSIIFDLKDCNGLTCLDWAAKQGTPEELIALTNLREEKFGIQRLSRAFHKALSFSNFETAGSLMRVYGHEVNPKLVFERALLDSDISTIDWMLTNVATGLTEGSHWILRDVEMEADYLEYNPYVFRMTLKGKLQKRDYTGDSYSLLFLAIFLESASLVRYFMDKGFPLSDLHIGLPTEDINGIFTFLVRHELTALWQQLMLINTRVVVTDPWYQRYLSNMAITMYDHTSNSTDELSYKKGEIMTLLDTPYTECWRVSYKDKTGVIPAINLLSLPKVRALWNYTAEEAGELTFRQGDEIVVLEDVYRRWQKGMLGDSVGIFLVNCVVPVKIHLWPEVKK